MQMHCLQLNHDIQQALKSSLASNQPAEAECTYCPGLDLMCALADTDCSTENGQDKMT